MYFLLDCQMTWRRSSSSSLAYVLLCSYEVERREGRRGGRKEEEEGMREEKGRSGKGRGRVREESLCTVIH